MSGRQTVARVDAQQLATMSAAANKGDVHTPFEPA